MISNQVIQNSIDELRAITKVDLGVFDVEGLKVATTVGTRLMITSRMVLGRLRMLIRKAFLMVFFTVFSNLDNTGKI